MHLRDVFFPNDKQKLPRINYNCLGFPGGPVIKKLPANSEDTGSIPGLGTKAPHAMGQLSLHVATTKPKH